MANILITVNELIFSRKFIAAAAGAAVAAILLLVPIFPVTVAHQVLVNQTKSEPYQVTENHTETYQEPQVQIVPTVENQQKNVYLGGYSGSILKAGAMRYWSGDLPSGAAVEYAFSLGAPIDFYIVPSSTFSEYPSIVKIQNSALLARENLYFERGTFYTTQADTYYFVIYNPSGSDVSVLYASSAASWVQQVSDTKQVQTMVTKTKEVYGPVTMYRDVPVQVSQTSEVSRQGTLLDIARSKDPIGTLVMSFQKIIGGFTGSAQNAGKAGPAPASSPSGKSSQDRLDAYNKLVQNSSEESLPAPQNPAQSAQKTADSVSNSVQNLARNPSAGIDTCGAC